MKFLGILTTRPKEIDRLKTLLVSRNEELKKSENREKGYKAQLKLLQEELAVSQKFSKDLSDQLREANKFNSELVGKLNDIKESLIEYLDR